GVLLCTLGAGYPSGRMAPNHVLTGRLSRDCVASNLPMAAWAGRIMFLHLNRTFQVLKGCGLPLSTCQCRLLHVPLPPSPARPGSCDIILFIFQKYFAHLFFTYPTKTKGFDTEINNRLLFHHAVGQESTPPRPLCQRRPGVCSSPVAALSFGIWSNSSIIQ